MRAAGYHLLYAMSHSTINIGRPTIFNTAVIPGLTIFGIIDISVSADVPRHIPSKIVVDQTLARCQRVQAIIRRAYYKARWRSRHSCANVKISVTKPIVAESLLPSLRAAIQLLR